MIGSNEKWLSLKLEIYEPIEYGAKFQIINPNDNLKTKF